MVGLQMYRIYPSRGVTYAEELNASSAPLGIRSRHILGVHHVRHPHATLMWMRTSGSLCRRDHEHIVVSAINFSATSNPRNAHADEGQILVPLMANDRVA